MTRMQDIYMAVLLEDINGKFQFVAEAVSDIMRIVKNLLLREEFYELKTDAETIKITVREANKQLQDHEKRITKLEAKI